MKSQKRTVFLKQDFTLSEEWTRVNLCTGISFAVSGGADIAALWPRKDGEPPSLGPDWAPQNHRTVWSVVCGLFPTGVH